MNLRPYASKQETENNRDMKRFTIIVATATGVLITPALRAQHGPADHGAHQHGVNAHTEQPQALPKPVQAVFDNYVRIQTALAQDSIQGVNGYATVIANAVRADSEKALPADVTKQAEALAKASDIKAAREVFKPLSESLIKYMAANKAHMGQYIKVFCPMANARWLQIGQTVNNPYFGKSMQRCGKIET